MIPKLMEQLKADGFLLDTPEESGKYIEQIDAWLHKQRIFCGISVLVFVLLCLILCGSLLCSLSEEGRMLYPAFVPTLFLGAWFAVMQHWIGRFVLWRCEKKNPEWFIPRTLGESARERLNEAENLKQKLGYFMLPVIFGVIAIPILLYLREHPNAQRGLPTVHTYLDTHFGLYQATGLFVYIATAVLSVILMLATATGG